MRVGVDDRAIEWTITRAEHVGGFGVGDTGATVTGRLGKRLKPSFSHVYDEKYYQQWLSMPGFRHSAFYIYY